MEKELWWATDISMWESGEPRRLKHRPSSIPETERVKRTLPKATEEDAVSRIKEDAIRSQGLLLRQLLSTDRWYQTFAPEYHPSVRFRRIADAHGLTMEQVMRALQLAYEMEADGRL